MAEPWGAGAGAVLVVTLLAGYLFFTAHGCGVNIRNHCGYPVTTCVQSSNNLIEQYQLRSGRSKFLDFSAAGCAWVAGAIWASVGGKCAVAGTPAASVDRNLANLAEFTIGAGSGLDFYDLSNVNAYTIPLLIKPTSIAGGGVASGYTCGSPVCSIDNIPAFCQGNNLLKSIFTGAFVCINTDGTAGQGPTEGTRLFKAACDSAYSYNFDDKTSTFTCNTGSNYEVVFCPRKSLDY